MPVMSQRATTHQRADTGADQPTEPEAETEPIEPEDIEAGAIEAIESGLEGEPTEAELKEI